MATKVNEILQFASQDTGSNLLTQTEYEGDAQRIIGHQPGIARSRLENKVLRQASLMSAGLAQFIVDNNDSSVTDSMTSQDVANALLSTIGSIGGTNMSPVSYVSTMRTLSSINTYIDTTMSKGGVVRINGSNVTLTIGIFYCVLRASKAISVGSRIYGSIGVAVDGFDRIAQPYGVAMANQTGVIENAYCDVTHTTTPGESFGFNFSATARNAIAVDSFVGSATMLFVNIQ